VPVRYAPDESTYTPGYSYSLPSWSWRAASQSVDRDLAFGAVIELAADAYSEAGGWLLFNVLVDARQTSRSKW
jgi:hypothetical protein